MVRGSDVFGLASRMGAYLAPYHLKGVFGRMAPDVGMPWEAIRGLPGAGHRFRVCGVLKPGTDYPSLPRESDRGGIAWRSEPKHLTRSSGRLRWP